MAAWSVAAAVTIGNYTDGCLASKLTIRGPISTEVRVGAGQLSHPTPAVLNSTRLALSADASDTLWAHRGLGSSMPPVGSPMARSRDQIRYSMPRAARFDQ